MRKREDLTGQVFGRLTALEYAGSQAGKYQWHCRCVCGQTKTVFTTNLKRGTTTSCGCFRKEKIARRNTTHGLFSSFAHQSWVSMWQRCADPNSPVYSKYKELAPPEAWKSFEQFYADMGERPSRLYSLDRIDNDKPYGPGNCRWATRSQQQRNKSSNRMLEFNGEILCVAEWAEKLNLPRHIIGSRLATGWSVERTLTTPVKFRLPPKPV